MRWDWVGSHLDLFAKLLAQHVYLSVTPVLYGLLISLPLGLACVRWPRIYPPVLAATSVLYALPSIALFVFLLDYTGLAPATAIIPLTVYTLSVLIRNVVDGLRSVPEPVRQAATAMGFGAARRLVQVELPIATPIVIAGLRVATVSNISLVSIGSLIGLGGLGQLFTDGFQRSFPTPIIVGIVLTIALAVLADGLLVLLQRLLTPWTRARRAGA
ncbi:ABC transporter permease [Carbonactinospora thermoautotrophica]|uniref:ABC transporter permease n=1 Tax=Carbonactinospora thermoautotrophica TaxID=1469144 RepID=A0A132MRF5_9ACTN|nr:ABC transporter permease subunit [Carbonactinospora thermoautotrophica]KWX00419.1 ABC transporter permease [Carbonactinospora thermoautotrophica]KWX01499.1 Binding-protein-dependent transport systems inner membrane component [Carbonactinospora thermoautotrophica]KWX09231.1 ABC transporter permease [Carbonactinospora thermoautotrophica]MCX9190627.1 ABC transporter permease [Carbonactinospora thermoautotrophica]